MVFPDELSDDPEADRQEDDQDHEDWLEVVEDEYIAQGDISVSETVDGHDPTPDLDEEDDFENEFDEAMHEQDED